MTSEEYLKAAFDGDVKAVRAYLDAGGNINAVSEKAGMTALMLAIWTEGKTDIVRLLLERGIDTSIAQASSGWRAITFAVVNGRADELRLLLEHGDTIDGYPDDWKGIMFAAQYRSHDTAEIALKAGADPNVHDPEGLTPLMRAAKNSDTRMLCLLLDHGADVAAADNEGMTALMYAATKAKAENVSLLLERGANPKKRNRDGMTAIEIAKEKGREKIVEALEMAI